MLFSDALRTAASRCGVLVEVGPGQLRTLVAQNRADLGGSVVIPTVRREYQNESDDIVLLRALGALWQAGAELDWRALRHGNPPRKASLPAAASEDRRLSAADSVDLAAAPLVTAAVRPEPHRPDSGSESGPAVDLTGVTATLAGLWRGILGVGELVPADDFFELGGDSMMTVRLLAGLEQSLGVAVPAVVVFQESTLGGMAHQIEAWQHSLKEVAA